MSCPSALLSVTRVAAVGVGMVYGFAHNLTVAGKEEKLAAMASSHDDHSVAAHSVLEPSVFQQVLDRVSRK